MMTSPQNPRSKRRNPMTKHELGLLHQNWHALYIKNFFLPNLICVRDLDDSIILLCCQLLRFIVLALISQPHIDALLIVDSILPLTNMQYFCLTCVNLFSYHNRERSSQSEAHHTCWLQVAEEGKVKQGKAEHYSTKDQLLSSRLIYSSYIPMR